MKKCPACQQKEAKPAAAESGFVIVGNMNVGKTTLFSRLCGNNNTSSSVNFPGTTVTIQKGQIKGTDIYVFDTPGIHSIFSQNEDEVISRDILLPNEITGPIKGIILVADAKNLRRSIAIALQYAEYGLPMLLVANMMDEATSRGITIDYHKLAEELGMEICATVAREGIGIRKVIARLDQIYPPPRPLFKYPANVEQFLEIVDKLLKSADLPTRVAGLLLLVGDRSVEQYVAANFGEAMLAQLLDLAEEHRRENGNNFEMRLATMYNQQADQIARQVQKVEPPTKSPFMVTFGDWCTQLSTGIPIAIAVLTLLYFFVGSFGATFLVDAINGTLFEEILTPWITRLLEPLPLLKEIIVDPDFGILPTGVFLALGLVLPVIFCFYLAFGILEDSGYLPRLSILLDRILQLMGLNGKGVISLVMGFSCVTMAILTTRMLDTEKEKNIAAFLLFLGFPCAPFMAVMLIILKKMPFSATLTVFGLIFLQILLAGMVAKRVLPGARPRFIMEIPPMRIPKLMPVLRMAALKTYFFMKEAIPVFILASAIVFVFARIGGLTALAKLSQPLVGSLLGLPEKSVQVIIKTLVRRESGAAELLHLSATYTNLQLVINLLLLTFLAPCLNATIVLFKERGLKAATVIMATVIFYAFAMVGLTNHVFRLIGITFT
ncbi:MAG: hypothetical protein A2521_08910 [Deltaproteobacteria bacterium RIFOXYD12_FULL_57_12]|nr:MAG: hypothetical protein A2521_08910 [Deltaproteobacteria bacterium RIFOXYD12_FULL_57_12]